MAEFTKFAYIFCTISKIAFVSIAFFVDGSDRSDSRYLGIFGVFAHASRAVLCAGVGNLFGPYKKYRDVIGAFNLIDFVFEILCALVEVGFFV